MLVGVTMTMDTKNLNAAAKHTETHTIACTRKMRLNLRIVYPRKKIIKKNKKL